MKSDVRSFYTYPTPFGPLTIGAEGDVVTAVEFGENPLEGTRRPSAATTACANQIMEYLAGKRTSFDVPCDPAGTPFQHEVWHAVANIPFGHTRTARDIAATIGAPESYRLVGTAIKRCPVPLLVPVHRVVGATGSPQGAGKSADIARALLALERKEASGA